MDRNNAINLLKDIRERIPQLSPQEVSLRQFGESYSRISRDYNDCRRQVIEFAENNNLSTEEQGNELTVQDSIQRYIREGI